MKVKALVLDLDDTLYEELTYVNSGFRAVADYVEQEFQYPAEQAMTIMLRELGQNGRGRVFDVLLDYLGKRTEKAVKTCLGVYRSHAPRIELYEDARRLLDKAGNSFPIYIVTDGNKLVQLRKLQALGLYDHPYIRKCYITRRYGIANEKPSPLCFMHICRREKLQPNEIVYVGDNPNKDFVGIKPLGFRTVRIMRGNFAAINLPDNYEAECRIHHFDELSTMLHR
ncbi:MAG: HAD family hydrolase [Paenibacillus sp.]|uniref:HAD family hydrolase n=1 Tax=Paenibacillus sp. TaxID=58172 RepID=UPI002902BF98|nr:HAD family hydrolase [Paenibacillus sp.]MDU2240902.1 HAD family hydrolase [Paenibacillus sp.]